MIRSDTDLMCAFLTGGVFPPVSKNSGKGGGGLVVVEEEGKEDGYFYRRGFLTIWKAPVARKHDKIVYLGALFAGRAIRGGMLIMPILVSIATVDGS